MCVCVCVYVHAWHAIERTRAQEIGGKRDTGGQFRDALMGSP